jgi:hypothetical protein
MRNVSDKFVEKQREKIKTYILYSVTFPPENPVFYEVMWKNFVEPDRPQMAI